MRTQISSGSPAAVKVQNAALFVEAVKSHTMCNLLADGAPKVVDDNKLDGRKQTSAGAPIVRIQDLSKGKGDTVIVDLFHQIGGEMTMNDDVLDGNEENITSSSLDVKVAQYRKAVDSGGKMTAQRTFHDLRRVANAMLGSYYGRAMDQVALCHAAGARGDVPATKGGWVLPTSGPSLAKQLVNDLMPPTYDRHVFGGDATALDNLDSADKFDLRVLNKMRLILDDQDIQIQSIRYEKDEAKDDIPFYLLLISPRQWFDWMENTDANFGGQAFRRLQASAAQRGTIFNHPIFKGECALYENILIRKMSRTIRFNAGSQVAVSQNNNDATVTTLQPTVRVNRAILMGAQAIADAWGMAGSGEKGGYHFNQVTTDKDYGNSRGHAITWMCGKKKIRFTDSTGRVNDHGVMVLDTAVSG